METPKAYRTGLHKWYSSRILYFKVCVLADDAANIDCATKYYFSNNLGNV